MLCCPSWWSFAKLCINKSSQIYAYFECSCRDHFGHHLELDYAQHLKGQVHYILAINTKNIPTMDIVSTQIHSGTRPLSVLGPAATEKNPVSNSPLEQTKVTLCRERYQTTFTIQTYT